MAVSEARRPLSSSSSSSSSAFSFSQAWEEEECLEYYGMISLHRMFEVVGAQLTENDVEVLSFLLDETQPWTHPLDPALWAVAAAEEGAPEATSPVLEGWRKKQQGRRGGPAEAEGSLEEGALGRQRPKNGGGGGGVQLLLELERRGKCDETNFVRLLQLLRVLTRHDLLPYVTLKRQRTVSPERYTYGPSVLSSEQQVDSCLNSASAEPRNDQWETGSNSSKRKRVSRGRAKSVPPRRRRGGKAASAPKQEVQTPTKVTCVEIHPWKSISIGSGKRAKYQTVVKIPRQTKKQKPKTVALFNASPILEATLHLDPAALLLNKL